MAIVDELITLLGFDVDDAGARAFTGAMDGVKRVTAAVSTALVAAEGAFIAYANAVAASTDELGKFSASFGVSSERLQQFEFATERAGGSAQDLRGDIASLTKSLASPIPGEFNQSLFLLGINVKDTAGNLKSADQVLLELADRFSGFSAQQKQILATQVGLSESTIRFISQGREEIERLSEKAEALGGILPAEATAVAAEYADRLTDVNLAINGIAKRLAISFLPGMTRALEKFEDWIIINKEAVNLRFGEVIEGIGQGFDTVFNAISGGVDFIKNLFPSFEGLTERIDLARFASSGLQTIIVGLAVVFSPLIAKVAAISAGVAALIIVFDDFVAFVSGEKSVIGTFFDAFLEKFPLAEESVTKIKAIFQAFVDGIGPLFIGLGVALGDFFSSFADNSTLIGSATEFAVNLAIDAFNIFLGAIQAVVDLITLLVSLLLGDFQTSLEIVKSLAGDAFSFVTEQLANTFDFLVAIVDKIGEILGLWSGLTETINAEAVAEKLEEIGGPVVEAAGNAISSLAETGGEIGEAAGQIIGGAKEFAGAQIENLSQVGKDIGDAAGAIFGALGFGGEEQPAPVLQTAAAVAPAGAITTTTNRGGDVRTTNNNTFNISGARSPEATANAVSGVLGRQQSSLSTAAQTGGYPGLE